MADINCDLTRFEVFEEDLNVPLELAAKQRRRLQQSVVKSPACILLLMNLAVFVTGSMDQVNEKLQHLSGTIQAHPAVLVIELRSCELQARVQPEKMMQDIFEVQPGNKPKSKVAKPKLVELQRYPGFNPGEPTPLPNQTALDQILDNVLKARGQGMKQIGYIADLKQLLNSTLMKSILLDSFWWFFLHTQQRQSSVQCQLFDRVSKNYVLLIMETWNWAFGDRFLQELPSSLSQAVFISFCCSFPQSLIQFDNNEFKAKVCDVVYCWFGGIRPTPRIYKNWKCDVLLPREVKEMELRTAQEGDQNKRGRKEWVFDLDKSMKLIPATTARSRATSPSRSVMSRSSKLSSRTLWRATKISINSVSWLKGRVSTSKSSSELQEDETCTREKQLLGINASLPASSSKTEKSYRISSASLPTEPPVARRGPDFMKNLYNLFGFSPLVLNFLQGQKLEPHAGENIFVTRTEIQRLPPYPFIGFSSCGIVLFTAKQ
ncbi:protein FAM227A-like [Leucoraja erinacea]|uniref:protein FAM227A-like n=1 Tax=Leucoraja erinaceus TaxID=7782 RepID=UPI0024587633|nr:protein FAM227A-like [Leucoraja erinacea]